MKVYLLKDVSSLGRKGEIHKVSLGYARNFLFPKKLVQLVTPQLIKEVAEKKKEEERQQNKRKEEAEKIASQLKKTSIVIPLKFAEKGKEAYASANKEKIITALKEKGISLREEQIQLKNPLKEVGDYTIMVNVYPEITVPLKVKITMKE